MNGKQARKIRKAANKMTNNQETDYYMHHESTCFKRDKCYSQRLAKTCSRYLYQKMKIIFKNKNILAKV